MEIDKRYEVSTKMKAFLDIENQTLTIESIHSGLIKKHFEEIVDFKEKAVIDSLIKLGWKPPESVKPTCSGVGQCDNAGLYCDVSNNCGEYSIK